MGKISEQKERVMRSIRYLTEDLKVYDYPENVDGLQRLKYFYIGGKSDY